MKSLKKFTSFLLALAVIFSCTAALGNNTKISAKPANGDDFEDSSFTAGAWETVITNTAGKSSDNSDASVKTPFSVVSDPDDSSNKVFLPNKSDKGKGPALSLFKSDILNEQSLKSVSLDFKAENKNMGGGGVDSTATVVPFYLEKKGDHTEATAIYIQFYTKENKLYVRTGNNGKYFTRAGDSTLINGEISAEAWVHLNISYDYSDFKDGKIKLDFKFSDDSGNEKTISMTYNIELAESGLEGDFISFGIGSFTNQKTYFDNVSFTAEVTEKDEIPVFYRKYKSLFSLSAWDDSHNDLLSMMASDFATSGEKLKTVFSADEYIGKIKALVDSSSADIFEDYKAFKTKWSSLLSKKLSADDKSDIENAIVEYNGANSITRMFLYPEINKLIDFYLNIKFYRDSDDYSAYSYNFNDNLNPFKNALKDDLAANEIVADPLDSSTGNKVLKLAGKQSAFVLKYWPDRGVLKSLKFKSYAPKVNAFNPWHCLVSYEDEGNYYALRVGGQENSGLITVRAESKIDYIGKTSDIQSNIDVSGWLEYEVIFSSDKMVISIKDQNGDNATISGAYQPGGTFGFGFFESYGFASRDLYIDDLEIELQNGPGDFDVNEEITDINVYYSGNTFLNPDDTMILTGEKLASTVDKIYMSKLEDDTSAVKSNSAKPKVVSQVSFDDNGDTSSYFADKGYHSFDATAGYEAEILQKSFNAVNAVIPKDLDKGIYSVKLTALKAEEGAEDKIIYVNMPDISFVQGDEGDIVTHGGTLRIIGTNLMPTGNKDDVTVKLVSSSGKVYKLDVNETESNNNESLELTVPDSVSKGEYQVYVHNGYGDNTTWSKPETITVGNSPRDSWPKTVFNVMNYGAVGDGLSNDTPAVVSALSAAAENGGGIVYFPKGVYSVLTTLAIPEKTTVLGDGEVESVIRYQARRWQYGKTPDALISLIGNVEIKDLAIQGTRFSTIIKAYNPNGKAYFSRTGETDNIYFTNFNVRFTISAGYPSAGGNGGQAIARLTRAEICAIIKTESSKGVKIDMRGATNNLRWDNFSFDSDALASDGSGGEAAMRIIGRQLSFKNSKWNSYNLFHTEYGAIFENCDMGSGHNPSGNGYYMYNNYLHDSWANNRELLTTDGNAYAKNISFRFIGNDKELMQKYLGTSTLDETAYLSVSSVFAVPYIEGYNMIVKDGQGRGQVRTVKSVKNVLVKENGKQKHYSVVFVDKPFTVAPNRRSKIDIHEPRKDMIFVKNIFREGAGSGSYGTMINSVWDSNEFSRHEGQLFDVNEGSLWYMTFINQKHYEAIYMHGEGFGSPGSAALISNKQRLASSIRATSAPYAAAIMGFSIRSCSFDGYGYQINLPGSADGISGFLIENSEFKNRFCAIQFNGGTSVTGMSAVLFRNNDYETDDIFDSVNGKAILADKTLNRQGYKRVIDTNYVSSDIILGDLNLDGKLSLKDATLLRLYLTHKSELTEAQLARADVNKDGKISVKDITFIRMYILGENPNAGDTSADNTGWIDGDF